MESSIIIITVAFFIILCMFFCTEFSNADEERYEALKMLENSNEKLFQVFDSCIETLRECSPYNVEEDSIDEKIFFAEVMFALINCGIMYVAAKYNEKLSDKYKKYVLSLVVDKVNKLFGDVCSSDYLLGCCAFRLCSYATQLRLHIDVISRCIDYDKDRHLDNSFISAMQNMLPQFMSNDFDFYNKRRPNMPLCRTSKVYYDKYLLVNHNSFIYYFMFDVIRDLSEALIEHKKVYLLSTFVCSK